MERDRKVSIATQLIVRFTSLGLLTLLGLSFIVYFVAKAAILDRTFEQLTSVRETKRTQVTDFFSDQIATIEVMASLPVITNSLQAYDSTYLQGVTSSAYDSVNQVYHPYLAKIKETYGLYDLFLVNLAGDIIYTVVHEPDFATNLVDGPYSDQNIAEAYREGLKSNTIVDFDHYAPSNGDPASFVSSPIRNSVGNVIGVLIGQIPLDEINAITQERTGLGESGETYLVGRDYLMRSDSRFSEESTVLKLKVETLGVEKALVGDSSTQIIDDYRGVPVLSSYSSLQVGNITFAILSEMDVAEALQPVVRLRNIIILITLFISVIIAGVAYVIAQRFISPIKQIQANLNNLSRGNLQMDHEITARKDELGDMIQALKTVVKGLHETADFATAIGEGNLEQEYQALGEEDTLGSVLIKMRDQLLQNRNDAQLRNWSTQGLTLFTDTLRNAQDIEELSNQVLKQLVNYLEISQGAIFLVEEEGNKTVLHMKACYAYQRQKFINKSIPAGDGVIGQAYLEKETIYLTEVPTDYADIRSGLGGSQPSAILVIPLLIEDTVEGILELASFTVLEDHQISFVEKVAESIASALRNARINTQTHRLLMESQEQAEMMQAQEEEMRQNMEELSATQEEMHRKEKAYLEKIEKLEAQLATEGKS
ncbi:MAG: GAF domain-containing protein [Bacteroidota bacterium]